MREPTLGGFLDFRIGPESSRVRTISRARRLDFIPFRVNHPFHDFVFDGWANWQQLKCLSDIDEFSWEYLAVDAAGSIHSNCEIEVLPQLTSVYGARRYLRSDNKPEFISRATLRQLTVAQLETAQIDPGKPWQNTTGKAVNGTLRDECLSVHWLETTNEAKTKIESWRVEYNASWPPQALKELTSAEFAGRMRLFETPADCKAAEK